MKTKNVRKTTAVKIISQTGESVLVEYITGEILNRCYIPPEKLDGLMVEDQVLLAGIPYGFPWEDIEIVFDKNKFANHLRNDGIWTPADALRNPQKLWGALRASLADSLSDVLNVSREERKRS